MWIKLNIEGKTGKVKKERNKNMFQIGTEYMSFESIPFAGTKTFEYM